jgi:hypothetical protein
MNERRAFVGNEELIEGDPVWLLPGRDAKDAIHDLIDPRVTVRHASYWARDDAAHKKQKLRAGPEGEGTVASAAQIPDEVRALLVASVPVRDCTSKRAG